MTNPPPAPRYVAYYRVSTSKQGRSGLGLEAQQAAVESFAAARGGELLASFQEVESGKGNARPELLKALAMCKKQKAVLVIAKLDRLSRNVAFIANLMEARTEFIACDMPEATPLTLHIMAAMAQHEREATSKRTKEALAAARARGVKLGNPRPDIVALQVGRSVASQKHRKRNQALITALRSQGLTLRQIAADLNERGIKGHHGGLWHPESVRQVLKQ